MPTLGLNDQQIWHALRCLVRSMDFLRFVSSIPALPQFCLGACSSPRQVVSLWALMDFLDANSFSVPLLQQVRGPFLVVSSPHRWCIWLIDMDFLIILYQLYLSAAPWTSAVALTDLLGVGSMDFRASCSCNWRQFSLEKWWQPPAGDTSQWSCPPSGCSLRSRWCFGTTPDHFNQPSRMFTRSSWTTGLLLEMQWAQFLQQTGNESLHFPSVCSKHPIWLAANWPCHPGQGTGTFQATCCWGVDGGSHRDLLTMPQPWAGSWWSCEKKETGSTPWPTALLYGVVNVIATSAPKQWIVFGPRMWFTEHGLPLGPDRCFTSLPHTWMLVPMHFCQGVNLANCGWFSNLTSNAVCWSMHRWLVCLLTWSGPSTTYQGSTALNWQNTVGYQKPYFIHGRPFWGIAFHSVKLWWTPRGRRTFRVCNGRAQHGLAYLHEGVFPPDQSSEFWWKPCDCHLGSGVPDAGAGMFISWILSAPEFDNGSCQTLLLGAPDSHAQSAHCTSSSTGHISHRTWWGASFFQKTIYPTAN